VNHHALARRRVLSTVGCADEPGDVSALHTDLAEFSSSTPPTRSTKKRFATPD
jgi:hypothetical protein